MADNKIYGTASLYTPSHACSFQFVFRYSPQESFLHRVHSFHNLNDHISLQKLRHDLLCFWSFGKCDLVVVITAHRCHLRECACQNFRSLREFWWIHGMSVTQPSNPLSTGDILNSKDPLPSRFLSDISMTGISLQSVHHYVLQGILTSCTRLDGIRSFCQSLV